MAGLGSVKDGGVSFLSVAGGFIWDRNADKNDPNYSVQEYKKADDTIGIRKGAQYENLEGKIVGAAFRDHEKYGESINVTFDIDSTQRYTVSMSMNNRYSQDTMKALMVMDLEKDIDMRPYDFVGRDGKRAQGISFRQDGKKLELKVDDAPTKEGAWFKSASKKEIKRFFEDLNDWYKSEIEEDVIPNFKELAPIERTAKKRVAPQEVEEVEEEEEVVEEVPAKKAPKKEIAKKEVLKEAPIATPLKMKKALKEYIEENYPDETLPNLSKEDLVKWYKLALDMEELPFETSSKESENEGEVSEDDLDAQLKALI